jgi:hypothetical protein
LAEKNLQAGIQFEKVKAKPDFAALPMDEQLYAAGLFFDEVHKKKFKPEEVGRARELFIQHHYPDQEEFKKNLEPQADWGSLVTKPVRQAGAFAQGVGLGATAGLYRPEVEPGTEFASGAGDFLGTAAANVLPYLAGPEAGIPANAAYAALREGTREASLGQELNPAAIAGQGALGALTGKLPAALGRGAVPRLLTGAGLGATTGASGRAIEQLADTGQIDYEDLLGPALFGGAIGGGVGLAARPGGIRGTAKAQPAELDVSAEILTPEQPLSMGSEPPIPEDNARLNAALEELYGGTQNPKAQKVSEVASMLETIKKSGGDIKMLSRKLEVYSQGLSLEAFKDSIKGMSGDTIEAVGKVVGCRG